MNTKQRAAEDAEVRRPSIWVLVDAVTAALGTYDKSDDHTPNHSGDDCIRCKLVAALPPYAQRELAMKASAK
jgi:hypothetical protein